MSKVLERLRKKHGYPVEINGETFHVRSLNLGELRRLDSVSEGGTADRRTGLFYALAICADETGSPAFPKADDETDAALADRVSAELADVPMETLTAISEAVSKIGKQPKAEAVLKN